MFSRNVGDEILKATLDSTQVHYSVTRNSKNGEILLKLVNPQTEPQPIKVQINGVGSLKSTATAITLAAAPDQSNSIDSPTNVVPVVSKVSNIQPAFSYVLPANSIVVLKLNAR
jgi:alpha-L-arabinofuranosidase